MNTYIALFLGLLVTYAIASLALVRWGQVKSDAEPSGFGEVLGYVFMPILAARGLKWLIPDVWNWPENVLAMAFAGLVLLIVLLAALQMRFLYALVNFIVIYGVALGILALVMMVLNW